VASQLHIVVQMALKLALCHVGGPTVASQLHIVVKSVAGVAGNGGRAIGYVLSGGPVNLR